jgi:hypothetical protein
MNIYLIIIMILIIYAVVISILYYIQLRNADNILKEKTESLKDKEEELKKRESLIVDKELCLRELTKIKTIHTSIQDILLKQEK